MGRVGRDRERAPPLTPDELPRTLVHVPVMPAAEQDEVVDLGDPTLGQWRTWCVSIANVR